MLYCTKAPIENATTTDSRIPKMISVAFAVFMYCPKSAIVCESEVLIFIKDIITAAPNNSKTIDTVVDVGIPKVLKKSNSRMSVIITAIKMIIISLK